MARPKKEKPDKLPEGFPTKENDALLKAISDLTEAVSKINEKFLKEEDTKPIVIVSPVANVTTPTATASAPTESQFPIPFEYTEIVNTVLNNKFKVDIKYQPDNAAFEFHILVPEEYSNAGKPHWDTYHEDRRSKVILNAYGANGVREWVTKVYENFNPEMKSRITYDRAQL